VLVELVWPEFVPFLQICTSNAIESINARIRRAVNARGHFPTEAVLPQFDDRRVPVAPRLGDTATLCAALAC
jgi:hypothetical protein